jgi:hypothetical protein|tara:strand:+ start:2970 stop:3302 length:333 start_codon:yes stop_codon:yes gene_type:complete
MANEEPDINPDEGRFGHTSVGGEGKAKVAFFGDPSKDINIVSSQRIDWELCKLTPEKKKKLIHAWVDTALDYGASRIEAIEIENKTILRLKSNIIIPRERVRKELEALIS